MQYINVYIATYDANHIIERGWAVVLQSEDRTRIISGICAFDDSGIAMASAIMETLKGRCCCRVFGGTLPSFGKSGHTQEAGSWDGGGRPRHAYLELAAEEAEHALLS